MVNNNQPVRGVGVRAERDAGVDLGSPYFLAIQSVCGDVASAIDHVRLTLAEPTRPRQHQTLLVAQVTRSHSGHQQLPP